MADAAKNADRKLRQKQIVGSRVIPIAALGLLVLFKFQNCAPASQYSAAENNGAGQVRIVDNWTSSPVAFLSPSQVVTPTGASGSVTSDTNVRGLCVGTDGDLISWSVTSVANPSQIVSSGQVTCAGGEFQLPVGALTFQSCSDRYEVHAAIASDSSQMALTLLEPDCPAVD